MLIQAKNRCINCFKELNSADATCSCGFKESNYQPAAHWLAPGTILEDRYCIGRVLGAGGFGITYVGYDLTLDIKVAIKEFFLSGYNTRNSSVSSEISLGSANKQELFEKNRDKFINEARMLAKLNDEGGIVSVQNYFTTNNTAYIIMEFLDGKTLKDYQQELGKLSLDSTLGIFFPIMSTLEAVHSMNLIHRDISPDNIVFTQNGKVKLIDFGAARDYADDEKGLSVVVKHGFAPLEQYRTHGGQGPWTDVYALCATIYSCLTNTIPLNAADRACGEALTPACELNGEVSKEISDVLMKGMSVEAADRYQTMGELKEALNNAYKATVAGTKTTSEPEAEPKKKSKKPLIITIIVLLLLLLGAGGVIVFNKINEARIEAQEEAEREARKNKKEQQKLEESNASSTDAASSEDALVSEEDAEFEKKLDTIRPYLNIDESGKLLGLTEGGKNLTTIELAIPKEVTSIEQYAFKGQTAIKKVCFENGSKLSVICDSAFENCTGLSEIELPDTVTFIGSKAFRNTGLKSITFPESVEEIWTEVCLDCQFLEEVNILSDKVTFKSNTSGRYFAGCKLSTVNFGENTTKIDNNLFRDAGFTSQAEVVIPASVERIGAYAFYRANVSSVKIESGSKLDTIGECAFQHSSIDEFEIPEGVRIIDSKAFANTDIKTITFPRSLTEVWTEVCLDCERLSEVKILSDKVSFKTNTSGRFFAGCNLSTVLFDEKINKIDNHLFRDAGFASKAEFVVPASIETIGNYAFYKSNLTSIRFMEGSKLDSIGECAFESCMIDSISIPTGVRIISSNAFRNTNIEKITIPETVTEIWTGAFQGCSNLRELELLSTKVQFRSNTAGYFFDGCNLSKVVFPKGLTKMPELMFATAGFAPKTEIVIPATVESVERDGFKNSNIYAIRFEEGSKISEIRGYAFSKCNDIEKIELPESISFIDKNAFANAGPNLVLLVKEGSYAHTWAQENNYAFEIVTEEMTTGAETTETEASGDNLDEAINDLLDQNTEENLEEE